ncbi:hypothetical protein GIB67_034528, partial [Kingdonia uniflora]
MIVSIYLSIRNMFMSIASSIKICRMSRRNLILRRMYGKKTGIGTGIQSFTGVAEISIKDMQIPLSGEHSILGRAVVVHADPDDLGKGTLI